MTLNNAVIEYNSTGICKIDLALAIKHFTNKSCIHMDKRSKTYRLRRFTHKQNEVLKVEISEDQALELINKLNLIEFHNAFFRNLSTFRPHDYYGE